MNNKRIVPLILIPTILLLIGLFLPIKLAFTFTEQRTNHSKFYMLPLATSNEFQIRYVHSIHLTDVIETYEVINEGQIRLLSMTYENLGIGLPGDAAEGETISLNNGIYTLKYNDKVIDDFTLFIGSVDAELAFRYNENELDLKEYFDKGESYLVKVKKLSFYQMLNGVDLNVKRKKAE